MAPSISYSCFVWPRPNFRAANIRKVYKNALLTICLFCFRIGFPIMLATTATATVYLLISQVLLQK